MTNRENFVSSDNFEQEIIDLFDKKFIVQALDFNSRGDSQLDVALHHNFFVKAEANKDVITVYDCSIHGTV